MQHNQTQTTARRGRKAKPINAQQLAGARLLIDETHKRIRTWDAVASHYGISKAAVYRIANDRTYHPSQGTIDTILLKAIPVASPKRPPRRFYRPCLSVELGEMIREYGIDVEATLTDCIKRGIYQEKP